MAGGEPEVFWGLKPGAWLPPCVGFGWWQAPFPLASAALRSLFCILQSRSVRNATKDTQTVRLRSGEVSCVSLSFGSNVFLLFQTRMALNKGAQAVIFDVSDDANAAAEVTAKPSGCKICLRFLRMITNK